MASGPGSRTSSARACAVDGAGRLAHGAGVAIEQRAAGADDHHVGAAAAGLADAQVEHAAAVGHVAVADDHDHVGAVEVVDARGVRIEQLPRAGAATGPEAVSARTSRAMRPQA